MDIVEILDMEVWAYESVLLLLGKGVIRLQSVTQIQGERNYHYCTAAALTFTTARHCLLFSASVPTIS
jgi:hypothetical protein